MHDNAPPDEATRGTPLAFADRSEGGRLSAANDGAPSRSAAAQRQRYVLVVILGGLLLQMAASWPLWWPTTVRPFPCIPTAAALVSLGSRWPDRLAATILSAATLWLLWHLSRQRSSSGRGSRMAPAAGMLAVAGLLAVSLNQHRGQVWLWHALAMVVLVDSAAPSSTLRRWRALVASIYVWSALSKLDPQFAATHGRVLMETLWRLGGLQPQLWRPAMRWAGWIPPCFELLAGLLLVPPRTRRLGLWCAVLMHAALLAILGPWGLHHSWGVLLWNATFLAQDVLLFSTIRRPSGEAAATGGVPETDAANPATIRTRVCGDAAGGVPQRSPWTRRDAVCALLVALPSLWHFGLLDDWPAWAVYAARTPRVSVQIRSEAAERPRFPSELRKYLRVVPTTADWLALDVDRWSLETVRAPKYPGERFSVGVAIALSEFAGADAVRVVIRSARAPEPDTDAPRHPPATPHAGDGAAVTVVTGLKQLRRRAARYWINARPRRLEDPRR